MNSKHDILLDSTKKLIALDIPDAEIVANLRQVNVSDADARALLAEARGGPPAMAPPSSAPVAAAKSKPRSLRPPSDKDDDLTEAEGVFGEVAKGWEDTDTDAEPADKQPKTPSVFDEEERATTDAAGAPSSFNLRSFLSKRARVESSPIAPSLKAREAPAISPFPPLATSQPPAQAAPARKQDIERLWDSGILTAVDARLDEMKRLGQDMGALMEAKAGEAMKKESSKIGVLLESQRALLLSKVQSEFEANRKQLEELLSQRLAEIRKSNELTQENLARIQAQKQLNEQLSKELATSLRTLEDSKAKWMGETNNELQRAELKFDGFLKTAEKRLDQLESRISKAIEVENHITEGLLNDARLKIDSIAEAKSKELETLVRKKLKEIDQVEAVAALDAVEKKLAGLSDFRESLRKDMERDFDAVYKSKVEQYNQQVKGKLDQVDTALRDLSAKDVKSAIGEFRLFREDFQSTVKGNVEKFNAAKKELNESMAAREKSFDAMSAELEQRLKELAKLEEKLGQLLRK